MTHRHEGQHQRHLDHHTIQMLSKVFRDLAMFILGAYAFWHELAREGAERPQILIMSAAMMGLPLIIRGDEKRQEAKPSDVKQEGS